MTVLADHLSPVLAADGEMLKKVEQSTISLTSLVECQVCPEQVERAFSSEGCGAVLVKLDEAHSAMYERFFRLQWKLGTRTFDNDLDQKSAAAEFEGLDLPVQTLLCRCGISVARSRKGLTNVMPRSPVEVQKLLYNNGFTSAIGRPLARNRKEFHPSVEWLLEQEQAGSLCDENPSYEIVSSSGDHGGSGIMGRSRADEVRLLALYREWKSARPEEQRGHGNKYNGDVYYGAFRGRTHVDCGCSSSAMTVLFGPGELRDRHGSPVPATSTPRELGGNLMVASPGEQTFTSLPYRLPCGSPYLVVFFELEQYHEVSPTPPTPTGQEVVFKTNALGWAATVHGVRRIEDTSFSRGQAVVHVPATQSDLA